MQVLIDSWLMLKLLHGENLIDASFGGLCNVGILMKFVGF